MNINLIRIQSLCTYLEVDLHQIYYDLRMGKVRVVTPVFTIACEDLFRFNVDGVWGVIWVKAGTRKTTEREKKAWEKLFARPADWWELRSYE